MVFPLLLPIVLESPGPGELVSSRIQGSPILFTEVSMGGAAGSRIVGGTGTIDSRLGGSEGLTIWIDETGTKLPVVVGIGVRPPPLPLPSLGWRLRSTSRRSRGAGRIPGTLGPEGIRFGSPLDGWTAAISSAAITTAWVNSETL